MCAHSVPQALGYVGVRAKDLGDWASYGSGLLGLAARRQIALDACLPHGRSQAAHHRRCRGGEGIGFFGWEVADAAALDALAARLENARVKVAQGARALADERHVKDLIVLNDPAATGWKFFTAPKRRRSRLSPAGRFPGSVPDRSGSGMWC